MVSIPEESDLARHARDVAGKAQESAQEAADSAAAAEETARRVDELAAAVEEPPAWVFERAAEPDSPLGPIRAEPPSQPAYGAPAPSAPFSPEVGDLGTDDSESIAPVDDSGGGYGKGPAGA